MLDIKFLFSVIGRYRKQSLKELAQDEGMAYITMLNKIGRDASKMKISTLEYMTHALNYTLCISVKDADGRVIHTMESEADRPMIDPSVFEDRREFFAENLKKITQNDDGSRKVSGGFQPNHEPVNNKKYTNSKK